MCSMTWWYFQWPWRNPNPVFKVTDSLHFLSRISQKRCILRTKLLKNTNRKPYTIYQMVPPSMTLSDPWPRIQGHDIFRHWISQKRHGRTGIVSEMFMADKDCSVEWLTSLCNSIVAQGRIPDDWKSSIFCYRFSKGSRSRKGRWAPA